LTILAISFSPSAAAPAASSDSGNQARSNFRSSAIRYNLFGRRNLRISALRDTNQPYSDRFMRVFGIFVGVALTSAGCAALADPEEPAATPDPPIVAPAAEPARRTGLQVYNEICVACHSPPGVGGAPALGDGDAWAPRIAQGMDTLIDHALHGFSSSTGVMPRKGGRVDLSDEEIIAAIEYMVEQVAQ
jgi:cytochrome c5